MPTTTTCPACNGPLRIPDELVGQRVRCPVCQNIFDASAPPPSPAPEAPADSPAPLWKNLNLELGDSAGGEPPPAKESAPPPSSRKPGLVGAVEVSSSGDDGGPVPIPAPPRPPPSRPEPPLSRGPRSPVTRSGDPRDRRDDEEDRPRPGPYGRGEFRRRDTEPHRGVLILVLGVLSVATLLLGLCYGVGVVIGLPLGITAWVLGNGDLRKIKNREMDEEGLGTTQAGWICGILGTILHSLILLTCGGLLTFVLIAANGAAATAPKTPFGQPAAPVPMPAPAPMDKDK